MGIEKGRAFVQHELFGGRGEVRVWSLIERVCEPFTAVLSCELAPGGSVGPHVQQEFPEIIIGIDGQGQASVDGRSQPLRAGEIVHLPLGSVLAIDNHSLDAALRYLIVKARR